jgi:hypothetical protein
MNGQKLGGGWGGGSQLGSQDILRDQKLTLRYRYLDKKETIASL